MAKVKCRFCGVVPRVLGYIQQKNKAGFLNESEAGFAGRDLVDVPCGETREGEVQRPSREPITGCFRSQSKKGTIVEVSDLALTR